MIRVSTKFDRPAPELVERLAAYSSATLHEAQGRLGALDSTLKPVDHRMSLCGPAFTVQCAPRDNLMLQTAIAYARPGDVIVVSAGAYEEAGSFGDVLANACQSKGLGGLITDTGVRDTEDLRALGFPVFSRSISIKGTVKETVGPMCEPVTVGGVLVRPGDVMRADADGVVVVRREDAAEVAAASQQRVDTEADYIAAYRAGRTVIDICGLEPLLAAKGLVIEE
ncbi:MULTISPECIES: 4-carboxy-4-hydroxy-2-oxoadipate aldolase/oxaloacetate decarboxylase [Streptomyces]|uniref:Putative 4-hydroxy-4-methyl-2-oxoglutarate aldolase n=1 Tax=Streptomyces koelreuteriae TaxID=2838015 RepID=A0ABX8FK59_9ACTN|nr:MULTISPECIES: 4-carboxy-4-hydroxy-2-oxoadipate aldolase/oxaloacetate decarboxylase [Streptomyces]QWB21529.1 4-carboxy-4-hydroxy-2-oxoadipate aldolase/oxaloacetate decarboxylase [Streptomyces koelreuteriae]UUA04451.1 4-carboxy-4-hydroxy-2-oxoadipate aldolase/oxaloacetate decarboxylase [Streptomyces koelreuteriae]UUA12076.1 4-carboxy-4-hydroxy-2-oxoadipate aldolase/oxaloacetate decarboxylase [Streptomyces sp. CRCS-T-1]